MVNKEYLKLKKELIKEKRLKQNLSQRQVAKRANLTIRQYQTFELGERSLLRASFRITHSICQILDIQPEELFNLEYNTKKMPKD